MEKKNKNMTTQDVITGVQNMEKEKRKISIFSKKDKGKIKVRSKKSKLIRRFVKIAAVLIVIAVIFNIVMNRIKSTISTDSTEVEYTVEEATRRDVTTVLSSSGTIAPLNIYDITTLVEGDVIEANFEEGDTVEKDQVLYQLTTDEVDSDIEDAEKSVTRAQDSYDKAVASYDKQVEKMADYEEDYAEAKADYDEALAEYNKALAQYDDAAIKASAGGVVTTLYVEEGDSVQENTKIADIYDDSTMILKVPFNAADVTSKWVGKTAEIEISGSFETIEGKVTEIGAESSTQSGNQIVKVVTIEVENPGSLTTTTTATATVSGTACNSAGTFEVGFETTLKADKTGDISEILIKEGSKVKSGDTILVFNKDNVEDYISTYSSELKSAESSLSTAKKSLETGEDNVENAQDSIDSAKETLEDAQDNYDEVVESLADTQITSPVTGVVVAKNTLVGDTISTSNVSQTLAEIYDISSVTFEMSIDELDIKTVEVGQTVNVTADAIEGTTFEGKITNVSLVSSSSGGVTSYPVTVQIDDVGELVVGMNVTGEIILESVENVITVPVDAIQRNNVVYVKDDTVTEAVGDVPAGFKSVEVTVGMSDDDYIEVTSGINEGDQVYVTRNSSGTTAMQGMGGMPGEGNFQGGGGQGGGSAPGGMPGNR